MLILMIRCIRVLSVEDWSYLALLDHLLRHTFVPRIRYLGFITRGKKGPLTTTGDLSACKSIRTLLQLWTVNSHHVAHTWLRWPPGPSNEAYLSSPHLEASPTMTFRACFAPAPAPVKPQPTPAILSQESVHTTLSITPHTKKRPSTSPHCS
jgi:hypothetical protein